MRQAKNRKTIRDTPILMMTRPAALVFALSMSHPLFAQDNPPQPAQDAVEAGGLDLPEPPEDAQLPEVEPVISDEEFNTAIPDLILDDEELESELESIAEFERQFYEQEQTSPADENSAVVSQLPELADGDASEEISDAPIRDAELTRPLTPIDQFEVQQVELAEAVDDTSEPESEIDYKVELAGLGTADTATNFDLEAEFERLSSLEEGDGEAANYAMLRARLSEDSLLIQRLLKSEGWYQPTVTTRIERSDDLENPSATAFINVEPGKRFTLSSVTIDADETVPPGLIDDNVALKVDEPIIASRILANEALIATVLPENGYPFAELGQRDILLDPTTATGDYTLPVEIGPRARIGGFVARGETAFGADHVAEIARFKRGELFDSRELDDLRKALVATGLFSTVSVTPERTGEPAEDGTEYVNIAVDQTAGPPRTIAGSFGFGTGQGFRLEGSWTHRNLFPPEGALSASLVAGTREQGGGVNFRRANAGQRDRTFEIGVNGLRSNFDAFEALTGRVGLQYSYISTPIWQKLITYSVGIEAIASVEEAFDSELGDTVDETYFIGALTGQIGFDTSDDLLNPTQGFRLGALVQPEVSVDGGFTPYVRAVFDSTAYYPISDNFVLAGRAKVGTIQGADRVDIAPSRRLYAGGGGSVRGFGFQQLGPKVLVPNDNFDPTDPEETVDEFLITPIGGRSVVEAAAEVRYRFGDYGVVAFVDAGQVYTQSLPQLSDIRFGAGIGGRFYTNFGPLRLDVATPINRREGESRINVYVSIGQAF
ncbi:autotransporter assembly complex family protein [Erythrobacter sp. YT30]|uniref:autotransporter assembly complex protein TamA n=1 Tax=Erythrobacter sp. YT30 TaxID=1735012 RepID=UPI00076BFCA8|nr:BamA/TamA family outer membrane protein [Erythrobacter sp. YT30]KWV90811.1 hypothetical protein AUC45_05530 [Erythrobacter sp. YT30]